MARYGSDRPDTRIALELTDLTDIVAASTFQVFTQTVRQGGIVRPWRFPTLMPYHAVSLIVWLTCRANGAPRGWRGCGRRRGGLAVTRLRNTSVRPSNSRSPRVWVYVQAISCYAWPIVRRWPVMS